jgi:hypothetical protein
LTGTLDHDQDLNQTILGLNNSHTRGATPMGNTASLIDLGELSKPATVLIEKVSDAIGGIAAPYQIRRIAQAQSDAEQIKALGKIRKDITLRALDRFLREETQKQANIENITSTALPLLEPNSSPEKMDNDWIVNFFDKSRLISDSEMQQLWAKVLAGEANTPGRYSKRTVNYLSSLDKTDAQLFTSLCSFGWFLGDIVPLVFEEQDTIYSNHGIRFDALKHLDEIGLISFEGLAGYRRLGLPKRTLFRISENNLNSKCRNQKRMIFI